MHARAVERFGGRALRARRQSDEVTSRDGFYGLHESNDSVLGDLMLAHEKPDAVGIFTPNYLHCNFTLKSLSAGSHVLCEKPLSMTVGEAKKLLAVQERTRVKIGEAFMVRTHPQWLRTRQVIASGRIGPLRSVLGFFSYFNSDPKNIRNIPECGGGALMDIGCYPVTASRFMFGEEPSRVLGLMDRDPQMKVDRLTSAILDFPSGQSTFTCSTQLVPYQRMHFLGPRGRIEIEIPFNAPNDRPTRILIDDGQDIFGGGITTETFPTCDQYTIQGDLFSRAVREGTKVPVSLADAVKNMAVIEAIFRSAVSGRWEMP